MTLTLEAENAQAGAVETKAGYCTLCKSRCGIINTVQDGRLISVEPLRSHPTGKAICAKGRSAPEIAHSSRRLSTPLRRTTPRGSPDPQWRPVSWDEALGEIAQKLGDYKARFGAETVAFAMTSPSATPIVDSVEWLERFVALYGSPNVCNATEICNWSRDVAHAFTFGAALPQPDWANADLILLWGHNPASVWLSEAGEIADAVKRGARLAVVDPRKTSHARDAAHWLAVRPGTDCVLALALANHLIETDRHDVAFLRRWTNAPMLVRQDTGAFLRAKALDGAAADAEGYVVYNNTLERVVAYDPRLSDEYGEEISLTATVEVGGIVCRTAFDLYFEHCARYPADVAAAITGVARDEIIALGDAIANASSVAHAQWTGTAQHANATQTSRAIATLYALTGHYDGPGGNVMLAAHPAAPISDARLMPAEQRSKALGAKVRPLGPAALGMVTSDELYTAILDKAPYRVRALFSFGSNLLLSRSDASRGQAALQALEFQVHCDMFETPTGREADILLPVGGPWEREALRVGFEITHRAQEHIQLRPALLPRFAQSRSDAEIVCDLAVRLGFGEQMFGGDIEAGWRHRLAPLGVTVDDLRANPQGINKPLAQHYRKFAQDTGSGPRGFNTETGRVEIYSELLLRHGYAALPDPAVAGGIGDESVFPLILTSAKNPYFCHSQHRGFPSLRRRAREPVAALSPILAARHFVAQGDWIEVRARKGAARFRAHLDPELAADVVVAEFGWWQATPELGLPGYDPVTALGSNYNLLTDSGSVDPVSGAAPLKSSRCQIARLSSDQPEPWSGRRELKIVNRHDEAGGIVVLDLEATDKTRLPNFLPGQHLSIAAEIGGRTVSRSYSLCGAPDALGPTAYRIAIKHIVAVPGEIEEGVFSGFSAKNLTEGALVQAAVPSGTFIIPTEPDFPVVLVAAGVGITPFLACLEAVADLPRMPEIHLYYSSRNGKQHAFQRRLAELSARLPALHLHNLYSQPSDADRAAAIFSLEGRIGAHSFDPELIRRRARFYMCGPDAMMTAITHGLTARGVPRFEIFSERFISPTVPDLSASDARFNVTFARSGRQVEWSTERGDLLTFAEAQGLSPASGCRVGQCESCAVRVLAGTLSHMVPVAELEDDMCLACQAIPTSDIVLDL